MSQTQSTELPTINTDHWSDSRVGWEVAAQPWIFNQIPASRRTRPACESAVEARPEMILLVPHEHLDHDLCWKAVSRDPNLFARLPADVRTPELGLRMVEATPGVLLQVPEELLTEQMVLCALSKDGSLLLKLPEHWRQDKFCRVADEAIAKKVGRSPSALHSFPRELWSPAVLGAAVDANAMMIARIPYDLIDAALCKIAVARDHRVFPHLPEQFQAQELFAEACRSSPRNVWDIRSKASLSSAEAKIVVGIHPSLYEQFPDRLKTKPVQKARDRATSSEAPSSPPPASEEFSF